jgi:NAD+ kinase
MDGQRNLRVGVNAPVRISVSRHTVPLVQRLSYSHFAVMRTKLSWSGGVANSHRGR